MLGINCITLIFGLLYFLRILFFKIITKTRWPIRHLFKCSSYVFILNSVYVIYMFVSRITLIKSGLTH